MLFSPRISTRHLAELCQRVATALHAGVDVRTVWRNEARRSQRIAARAKFRAISEAIERGADIREALDATGDYFPELFREIAHVGSQTGHLDEAFAQLGENYEFQLALRRGFLTSIAWPLIELGLAVLIIGFLIWVLGVIGSIRGTTIDILGFGLVGTPGLVKYCTFLAVVAGAVFFLWQAIRRGLAWTRPVQRFLIRLPGLGTAIESLALGRLSWALHLTLNAGMDARRAVALAVKASRNARYTDQMRSIDSWIAQGGSLYEAFDQAMVFPQQFMDVLAVGEQTGMVVESMKKLADQYREKSQAAMKVLAVVGFFLTFALIAAIMIALIFRIFSFYLGTINDAMQM